LPRSVNQRSQRERLYETDSDANWGGLAALDWCQRLAQGEKFSADTEEFFEQRGDHRSHLRAQLKLMSQQVLPRRVLMTADAVGGVWTYVLELARALGKHGIEVALATMGPEPSPAQREEAAAVPNVELYESNFKLEWMQHAKGDIRAAGEWLLRLEKRLRPDLVHLNGYAHGPLPWRSPKLMVGHSCLLSWWRACRTGEPPPEWNAYKSMVQRGLRAADLVVAPTRAMLNSLNKKLSRHHQQQRRRDSKRSRRRQSHANAEAEVCSFGRAFVGRSQEHFRRWPAFAWELPWAVCLAGEKQNIDGGEYEANVERELLRARKSAA
jgi:hypothetical protein